ncbi:phosphopentomutase [Anaerotalea alkaliphila]|uniref:Phosphopentomutase n=1 Tax=Anaerotalea alkaliphila TaxID=2662126 RepID=A0A7X5KM26_9FIRM|nr:phosphopentomutase [Anaerotalea alkaliphila]NDL66288.1 phosphopentomutase [Anaerotalea alkaliphila]
MVDRIVWIVLDSVGVGELPDAGRFGDEGSNTLVHTVQRTGIRLPHLAGLGLGRIQGVKGIEMPEQVSGIYGKCAEMSNGKDTTIGHWEMAGIHSPDPLPTYPEGFPEEVLQPFMERTGYGVLCNRPYSGTDVIRDYGAEHMETGKLIVYTSADSVFQIAAHEAVVDVETLYKVCSVAREILQGKHGVARVIARPFQGEPGKFTRTANRRDFSLDPPGPTVLDRAKEAGLDVVAIGKIEDIFNGKGITHAIHTKSNMEGVDVLLESMEWQGKGIIFANLVEFDSAWGHRNDVAGYARGLVEFDDRLPEILGKMRETDVLVINADHGCDPTTPSTDHSREYVPLLLYGHRLGKGVDLGIRSSFADIGQTLAELLGLQELPFGKSFAGLILPQSN